ncbi:unnamed protein product [Rhizophagus irregularis]|nr:unnamed protein product [Rhizophagus irregularis]CAB4424244.1 unnamed protein product [Rhizophagus irregularis]
MSESLSSGHGLISAPTCSLWVPQEERSAWSHAQQDNLPLMKIYHEHFDTPWLEIEPIHLHANITEVSYLGKFLYKEQNLPELFCKQPRDKYHKTFNEDRRQFLLRKSNLESNYNPTTESLTKHRWLSEYSIFLFPAFLFYFVVEVSELYIALSRTIAVIDDRNFFQRPGLWARRSLFRI